MEHRAQVILYTLLMSERCVLMNQVLDLFLCIHIFFIFKGKNCLDCPSNSFVLQISEM